MKRYDQISVKEYGSSFFLNNISTDILEELKKHFPDGRKYSSLLACASCTGHL
ncbi:MAG: hypothetical protein QW578_07200 [Thermoplasmatales archaeon]